MIRRLLSAALVAGFLAAVVATGLQLALTTPLILKAETYQQGAGPVAKAGWPLVLAHAHAHNEDGHAGHDSDTWRPGEGLPRMAFTGLATLIGGVGYALLLGAALLALRRPPTVESGLALGVAGFAVVALAPAIGLPPELPGMAAAPLDLRQAWWIMTVAATAVGLYLIAVRRVPVTIAGGLILVVVPHLIGAPHAADVESRLPAALATHFAARSLAVSFVFWTLIGAAFGWAWVLLGERRADV